MKKLRRVAQPVTKLLGSGECVLHLWRGIALRRDECRTKPQLENQLLPIPLWSVGHPPEQFYGITETGDRVSISRALQRLLADAAQVLDRLGLFVATSPVMR